MLINGSSDDVVVDDDDITIAGWLHRKSEGLISRNIGLIITFLGW